MSRKFDASEPASDRLSLLFATVGGSDGLFGLGFQMMRAILIALVVAVGLSVGSAGAAEVRLVVEPDGRLLVASLPPILGEEEVQRKLRSGLTTPFVVRAPGLRPPAAARVEVRYELWDG